MEIRYSNTLGDLVRFNFYHVLRTGVVQALLVALLVVHVWTFGRDIAMLDQPLEARILAFIVSLLILLALLVILQLLLAYLSYRPSKNKALLTDHVLRFSDDGLVEETRFGSSRIAWSGIPKVAQNGRYIFIYIQQNAAHVVPKRVFPSADDAAAFYEAVEKKIGRR
ncbi:MAG TPA: YcxB family protein [Thermoanaerobaculia bacterium]|nr:YcxB family protein [Thermoanaerobaculia bacterium]